MARPIKHNADYFSHDVGMRDDVKIKAIRRKFKHTGYSVWVMLLELLTSNEYFEYEWTELNIELLGPDFDCDAEEIKEIVNYCITLNLLQITNGYLHCNTLTKRLEETVLLRRKDYCSNNSKRFKLKGINDNINGVNDNINTQSKGKEIKPKKSKIKESKLINPEIIYSRQMINNITTKFAEHITDRFKLNNFLVEIDEDWGGWDNFLDICFGDDVSIKNNYNNKLNEYRNGIFAK